MKLLLVTLLLVPLSGPISAEMSPTPVQKVTPAYKPRVAIVIDDLGANLKAGERLLDLPVPVALSILPYTEHATELAEKTRSRDWDVMLHLPMEHVGVNWRQAPGALRTHMQYEEFLAAFRASLDALPQATGFNNHMGSRITQNPRQMRWLMRSAGNHNLFFLDSRTTPNTVAEKAAADAGLRSARRDVFLDDDPDPVAIHRQFERLLKLAREQGKAIAIGHPYPETLEYLETRLPELRDEYEFVKISALLNNT